MPHKRNPIVAERICGLARVVRGVRARRARERRALARARHLALVGRAGRAPRRVPRGRLHARPLRLARRRARRPPRADAREPRREPRALLQPAAAARARRVRARARRGLPARAAARDARVGRGARLPRARRAPTPRSPARVDLDAVFDLGAYTRHVDVVFDAAPRARAPRRSARMPEAASTSRSGKVRELYALDDERLLLVASDRISTFDVVLPTDDPRQGPRAHRAVGVLVRAHARASSRTTCSRSATTVARSSCRRLEMLPIECVVRGYLAGSGWKDYRDDRRGLRPRAARRAARVRPAARADLHAGDEGGRRATTRTSTRGSARRARRRRALRARSSEPRSRSTASRAAHAEARGIILADTKFELGVDARRRARARRRGADAGLVALLARRRATRRAAPSRRSTSSSSATTASARLGQDAPRARSCPTTSSPGRARATSRRSSG